MKNLFCKKLFTIILLSHFTAISFAQITELEKTIRDDSSLKNEVIAKKWTFGGLASLNISQASFTNWAAGGENSVGGNALVSLHLNYKDNNSSWDNMLDIGYGLLQQGDDGIIKTDDKIDFSSKYGRRASKHWYYAVMLNFKTQMDKGYDYPNDSDVISNFLAPAYLIGALGMDYKPASCFTGFISPITAKMTIVNDDALSNAGAFGVTPGDVIRNEFGGYVRLMYNDSFFDKTLTILSKLDLFSNYTEKPANIDVTWENTLSLKINKFISATLTTQLVYDDDVKTIEVDAEGKEITKGPKLQFKEVIGIGLAYKF